MRNLLPLILLTFIFESCHKNQQQIAACNIQKVYADNAAKVTITNGVWGTVSFMEGDCMPVIPPSSSTCKNCPVQRTIRIYQYTTRNNATPSGSSSIFYDSFSTQLVTEIISDRNGFFQVDIPSGNYTIVPIENGKLYVGGLDGQGGLSPITFTSGKQNINLIIAYKAVF